MAEPTKATLKAEWKVMLRRMIIAMNRAERAEAEVRRLHAVVASWLEAGWIDASTYYHFTSNMDVGRAALAEIEATGSAPAGTGLRVSKEGRTDDR